VADGGGDRADGARDAALVARVKDGDRGAFEALYREHVDAVRRAVGGELREPQQVPDVVQEAFTRALGCLPNLRDGDRFRPWLLSIARHVATDHMRSRARTPIACDEDAIETAAVEPGPAELAELADLAQLVRAGMAELSPRDATAVALVTHLGFSPAEVAAALGVSPGAAKVIVHRARKRLRNALLLEVLVRDTGGGCPHRPLLGPGGDRAEALKHVLGCAECMALLTAEVNGYDVQPSPSFASRAR
jgi:RNA polymerase sigma-70 factor (ECF subfamily)